jgi:hypothetical protein
MQRHRALTLVSLLPLVLAAGCGESPPEDPCGSGRPRWVPIPDPEGIDMQFHVALLHPGVAIPQPRLGYSVVFDGERFLFWGGYRLLPGVEWPVPSVQGAQYDPRRREWLPWPDLDDPNAPALAEHVATDGAVYGGLRQDEPGGRESYRWELSEHRYARVGDGITWEPPRPLVDEPHRALKPTVLDPESDLILALTADDPPEPLAFHAGQPAPLPSHGLSGDGYDKADQGLVFGTAYAGFTAQITGGLFEDGAWKPLPEPGRPSPRMRHSVAGRTVWGGAASHTGGYSNDGARLTRDGRWVPLSQQGAPAPRVDHVAVHLEPSAMLVFGGRTWDDNALTNDGALYDAREDRWTPLPSACAPPPMSHFTAVPVPVGHRSVGAWGDTAVLVFGQSPDGDFEPAGALLLLPAVCCTSPRGGVDLLPPHETCPPGQSEIPIEQCADRAEGR